MFPFLFELPAIRGEVLARDVLRIPLDGVEQDVARSLLVLHQLEGAAAPVRSDLGGSLLAAVLLEHHRVLQFAQRAADETPVAFGKLRLGKIGLGRLDSREVFFGMRICCVETGGLRKTSPKPFRPSRSYKAFWKSMPLVYGKISESRRESGELQ